MGQYYIPTLIDQEGAISTLYSHDFDNGLKLMEHSWIGNDFVNAVLTLIDDAPVRIAWVGDYSDSPYEGSYAQAMSEEDFSKVYKAVWDSEGKCKLSKEQIPLRKMKNICTMKTVKRNLVNHSRHQYLNLGEHIQRSRYAVKGGWENGRYNVFATSSWFVHPLPLLTACGNGRGGGDYGSEYPCAEMIGAWAFDLLEYTVKQPKGYEKVSFHFSDHKDALLPVQTETERSA